MKTSRKVPVIACVLALLSAALWANGGGEAGEGAGSPTTLTIMGTADSIKEIERTEISRMFKEETGITVDYQLIQDSQYYDLLYTKLNSGTCTDIFVAQSGALNIASRYNPGKNCVDLSNEPWIPRYNELVKQNSMADGKVYCQTLWNTNSVWAMVYNKTMFDELGLSVPATYDEFEAACAAIAASGVTPVYECAADAWHPVCSFIEMLVAVETARPGTYEKLNRNEMGIADIPEAYTLVDQFQTIGQEYSGSGVLSNEFANSAAALSDGSYAMTVNRVDFIAQFDRDYPDAAYGSADFAAFVVPYIDNQILNVNVVTDAGAITGVVIRAKDAHAVACTGHALARHLDQMGGLRRCLSQPTVQIRTGHIEITQDDITQ